jgi:uncharacterized protein
MASKAKEYHERAYRHLLNDEDLVSFQVKVKETDLLIRARQDLHDKAYEAVLRHRYQLEQYISEHPQFFKTLSPWTADEFAPPVVRDMVKGANTAGVGPMAAVAGTLAELVGKELLAESPDVIVENGGDIFVRCRREIRVAIFAGDSPLSFRLGLRIPVAEHGWGVCTSSATVGPSLSLGRADAVCVLAESTSLADAAATAIGNLVRVPSELSRGLEKAKSIPGLTGVVIIIKDKMGAWGGMELFPISDS